MEFLTLIIHAFSVTLSLMLVSCSSDQLILQKPAQQYVSVNSAVQQRRITPSLLPRKLKLEKVAEVKSSDDKDIVLQRKLLESASVEKENVVREAGGRKGTWREWVEGGGPTKSEYFTMDYSWVRRRRPIHNKQTPFLP